MDQPIPTSADVAPMEVPPTGTPVNGTPIPIPPKHPRAPKTISNITIRKVATRSFDGLTQVSSKVEKMSNTFIRSLFKNLRLLFTLKKKFLRVLALIGIVALILNMDENMDENMNIINGTYDNQLDPEYLNNSVTQLDKASITVKVDEGKVFINDTVIGRLVDGKDNISNPRKNFILLSSSLPRSGSSFIGELISSVPGSIYFFEPDLFLRDICSMESCYSKLLTEIFSCSFNDSFISFMTGNKNVFTLLNDDAKLCQELKEKPMYDCQKSFDILAKCKAATTIVVKTVRLRLSWIQRDLSRFPAHLKVINLIRDPRPVIFSIKNFGWLTDTEKMCRRVEDDINTYPTFKAKFSGRVKLINYERFCSDITHYTNVIFSFLGYVKIPMSTQMYLKKHTEYRGPQLHPFFTAGDSIKTYSRWRETIPSGIFHEVEKSETCRRVISQLNFTIFGSIARVRNISEPLFKGGL
ncbi:carbohydrate sulfotransferase 5-like [Oratosquilla oratoria]|uniref:carbohydrate sulfotransferase 5-like n=1 Tax=Oratosquilla oratoria TaxID=337810 RepID=UPI003F770ED7